MADSRPVSGLELEEQSVAEYYEHEIYIDLPGNSFQYRWSIFRQPDQSVTGYDGRMSQHGYAPVHSHVEVAEIQVTLFILKLLIPKSKINYRIKIT